MEQKHECVCKKLAEENKQLKKQVKLLKEEIAKYKAFIGGAADESSGKRES